MRVVPSLRWFQLRGTPPVFEGMGVIGPSTTLCRVRLTSRNNKEDIMTTVPQSNATPIKNKYDSKGIIIPIKVCDVRIAVRNPISHLLGSK